MLNLYMMVFVIAVPNVITNQKARQLLKNMLILYMKLFLFIIIVTNVIIKQKDKEILNPMLNLFMMVFIIAVPNMFTKQKAGHLLQNM